jgi:hypothetical protein
MDAGRQRRRFACSGSRAVEEKSDRFPAAGSRFRLQASLARRSYWPSSNYSLHGPIKSIFRDRRDLSLNRSSDMSLLVYLRVGDRSRLFSQHCRLTLREFVTLDPQPYPTPLDSAGQGRAVHQHDHLSFGLPIQKYFLRTRYTSVHRYMYQSFHTIKQE